MKIETLKLKHSPVPLGQVVATANAVEKIEAGEMAHCLARHRRCDWGEVSKHDWKVNEDALTNGDRLLSSYRDIKGTKFWIITEADRSVTTILLPEDY